RVTMADATRRVAAHMGEHCVQAAGHYIGHGFSCQASLMHNERVWPAMANAFVNTRGDLADRLLAALDAAQGVGGDIRGKQSAALIVVRGRSSAQPWADREFDLRVEDNAEPLTELHRLVVLER